jgi:DNA-directed RNA polymerase specialized sigma24 family protein
MNQEPFDKLLEWLERDREQAAQKYEKIRHRLIRFFICNRCGDDAECLADETFDRVMRKLKKGEVPTPYVGEKSHYFIGFARHIAEEHERNRRPREVPPPEPRPDDAEAKDACLEECFSTINAEDRWLAVEYYRFEKSAKSKNRRELAKNFNLSLAGLRTRVFRIRELLRPCIEECLERVEVN